MPHAPSDKEAIAARLGLALTRLKARRREESGLNSSGLSASQISIFQRLRRNGPMTAAELATLEHVSQQAIAQSIAPMKTAGIVQSAPDPNDGRKTLISLTESGYEFRETLVASGNAWLLRAMEATLDDEEVSTLEKAIELLERVVDADC